MKKRKENTGLRTWMNSTRNIAILSVNDPDTLQFYYICCKRRAMIPTIRKIKKRHPEALVMYMQRFVTNGTNLFFGYNVKNN